MFFNSWTISWCTLQGVAKKYPLKSFSISSQWLSISLRNFRFLWHCRCT